MGLRCQKGKSDLALNTLSAVASLEIFHCRVVGLRYCGLQSSKRLNGTLRRFLTCFVQVIFSTISLSRTTVSAHLSIVSAADETTGGENESGRSKGEHILSRSNSTRGWQKIFSFFRLFVFLTFSA